MTKKIYLGKLYRSTIKKRKMGENERQTIPRKGRTWNCRHYGWKARTLKKEKEEEKLKKRNGFAIGRRS